MIQWRRGVVVEVRSRWAGAVEYAVLLASDEVVRALGYVEVVGDLRPGTAVLLNTTALERGLGTGGLPVVVADLHSALPAILAGLRETAPSLRVAYVMTDGGALPIDFSRTVAGLRDAGWLDASITVGQAFGGDLEAVNVHTGLLAARHVVRADVVVVSQGPGNLGTGTRWGFSGTSAGEAVNAAATLHGRPVCSLRISEADPRERHRGVSHHSLTAYGRVSLVPGDVPVPLIPGEVGVRVLEQARTLCAASRGRLTLHEVATDGLDAALRDTPVPLRTMGRGYDDDRAGFLGAAVAGRYAAGLVRRASHLD